MNLFKCTTGQQKSQTALQKDPPMCFCKYTFWIEKAHTKDKSQVMRHSSQGIRIGEGINIQFSGIDEIYNAYEFMNRGCSKIREFSLLKASKQAMQTMIIHNSQFCYRSSGSSQCKTQVLLSKFRSEHLSPEKEFK